MVTTLTLAIIPNKLPFCPKLVVTISSYVQYHTWAATKGLSDSTPLIELLHINDKRESFNYEASFPPLPI